MMFQREVLIVFAKEVFRILVISFILIVPASMMFDAPNAFDTFFAKLLYFVLMSFPVVAIACSLCRLLISDQYVKHILYWVPFAHFFVIVLLIVIHFFSGSRVS